MKSKKVVMIIGILVILLIGFLLGYFTNKSLTVNYLKNEEIELLEKKYDDKLSKVDNAEEKMNLLNEEMGELNKALDQIILYKTDTEEKIDKIKEKSDKLYEEIMRYGSKQDLVDNSKNENTENTSEIKDSENTEENKITE